MGLLGDYTGFQDMFDGGGAGRSGPTFEGGALSDALNALGVRPHGYRRREAEAVPAPRPRPAPVAAPITASPIPNMRVNPDYGYSGPVGMNPVTPYDEAARFGLLAPEPHQVYSGRGYVGMPINPELMYDDNNTRIHEYLRSVGALNY